MSAIFSEPTVQIVLAGTILLGMGSGIVGSFAYLRRRSLVGDAIAHAVLPGVCLAFIISGDKNPWVLLTGAAFSGWLATIAIDWIVAKSKLSADSAIALVLSIFFGVGIVLLTSIQSTSNAAQSGLDKFLFGKAASMSIEDVFTFGSVSLALILLTLLVFKELRLLSFNEDFGKSLGLPMNFIKWFLATLTVLATVVGIQVVGVVLMAALLIAPAAVAHLWTDRLGILVILAGCVGAFGGLFGTLISFSSPSMPTGPWIVVVLGFLALISIVFAKPKGMLYKVLQRRKNERKILSENTLKLFHKLGEKTDSYYNLRSAGELHQARLTLSVSSLKIALERLTRSGFLDKNEGKYQLSELGFSEARHIVRLHRLWELYLTRKLHLPADHVHGDAEALEHLINPEIEKQLELELNFPTIDPHKSTIPKSRNNG